MAQALEQHVKDHVVPAGVCLAEAEMLSRPLSCPRNVADREQRSDFTDRPGSCHSGPPFQHTRPFTGCHSRNRRTTEYCTSPRSCCAK
eukprot:3859993-Pyramimonas_sp.AAC.1